MRHFGILVLLLAAGTALAAENPAPAPTGRTGEVLRRGERIATAVGTVTSTAISPLLGVCVLGAAEYFRTPAERRAALPGYARPWFWISVSVLLLLIVCKDSIGGMAAPLKKPLDALEVLLVNKASLLLIAFPVVLHEAGKIFGVDSIGELFASLPAAFETVAYAADKGMAGQVESGVQAGLVLVVVAAGLATSFVVWLVGDAFDVLVLLSPFPFVDLLLKAARSLLFAVLATATLLSPETALILSAIVIVACMILSGWAARLLVYGVVMSWEILAGVFLGVRRPPSPDGEVRGFSARRMNGIPKRSFGRIRKLDDGSLAFRRRRWMVGPPRTITLNAASSYELGRGLLQYYVIEKKGEASKYRLLFAVPPSYRGGEAELVRALGLAGARDLRWRGGLAAFWRWMVNDSGEPEVSAGQAA